MLTVAVVGAGYWGKNLIRTFYNLEALRSICDLRSEFKNIYPGQYPGITFSDSYGDVLSMPDIDGIIIATPAETHCSLAEKALLAGKDILVEKPLALSPEDAEDLIQIARARGRILMVGHILQYHPAVLRLKELIRSGELGQIRYIYSNRLNMGKIRTEENILWSFAPHDISTILMLLEEFPIRLCATGGNYLQTHVADTTLTTMDFKSGVKAHIFVSWLHPFKEQKLVVVGSKKMAVFDDVAQNKLVLYSHSVEWVDRYPVASKGLEEVVPVEMKEPLREECLHFLECMRTRQTPRTDGEEGLRVLKVLQASQESLNRNGETIDLSSLFVAPSPQKRKYFAHHTSVVDKGVEIGEGTKIWHFSHILSGSRIGRNSNIGQNVVVGPDVTIGDNCKIQNNVSVYKGVTLEDDVFCGPSMVFTNVYNPRAHIRRMDEIRHTLVKKGATLGANCTIVCGVTIGRYAFVGAGAVVTRNVPDYALVVGNPARRIGWMCECGNKLDEDKKCHACGKRTEIDFQDPSFMIGS